MNKIVDFIYKSSTRRLSNKNVKLNNYLLFIVKQIIVFYDENEDDLKTSSMRKKSLREIQILIEKTGIIEACLGLVRKHDVPEIKEMLPSIFSMFCKILKKGNLNSQTAMKILFLLPLLLLLLLIIIIRSPSMTKEMIQIFNTIIYIMLEIQSIKSKRISSLLTMRTVPLILILILLLKK